VNILQISNANNAQMLKSKKHRVNSYVEQPIDDTEQYVKCGVCNLFAHRSSFEGTDRCNLCTIDSNSSKKHCDICNCYVKPLRKASHNSCETFAKNDKSVCSQLKSCLKYLPAEVRTIADIESKSHKRHNSGLFYE
jgi:hypothetical protein